MEKVAKVWSVLSLAGVLALIAWAYVNAHALGRWPRFHPWPPIGLLACALLSFGIPVRTAALGLARIVSGALAVFSAVMWLQGS